MTRDAERIPGVEVVRVQEPDTAMRRYASFLADLEHVASDADLLIYQRTWGLPPETIGLWRRLENRGCQTASYHLDLYVGLKREATIDDDPFWRTGVVFTADGDPGTQRALEAMGVDHRWMPAAIVSDECTEVAPRPQHPEIVFVGSRGATYHEEWPWRQQLIDGLTERYGSRFFRWPTEQRGRLHGENLSRLYSSAACVVGDSLALPGHRDYWSDRFYETVGRAGFLIGPNVPGIEQHFKSGEHLDLYEIGDLDHVFELVDQALDDPLAAREIARAGMAHVRALHTYRHRVEAILASLGLA